MWINNDFYKTDKFRPKYFKKQDDVKDYFNSSNLFIFYLIV